MKTHKKNIVIFYDDAQNLYGRTRPNWSQVGIELVGGGRSRVLKECFRNSRQIVQFAFNVLLGAKALPDVRVQMREFADVDYLRSAGLVEEYEDRWDVRFAKRSYVTPEVRLFQTRDEEKRWLCQQIDWLISEQGVKLKDILVVFDRSTDFQNLDSMIAAKTKSIQGILKPFGMSPDKDSYIFRDDHLTLSTIKGAKGYDAPVVFLVGADQFKNDKEGRASFYVGATRARMFLFVSGLDDTHSIAKEAYIVQEMMRRASRKLRVYELAKELSIDSRELVAKLKAARIPVKNYMSMLDEQAAIKSRKVALNEITGPIAGGNEVRPAPIPIRDGKETAQVKACQSDARVSEKRERDAGSQDDAAAHSTADKKPSKVSEKEKPAIIKMRGKTFIIDGTNVMRACTQRRGYFSLEALLSIVLELKRQGADFICIFDANTWHMLGKNGKRGSDASFAMLMERLPDGFIQITGGKEADDFILIEAQKNGCLIISNDRFKEYRSRYPWLEKEHECLLKGNLIRDHVVFPDLDLSVPIRKDITMMTHELINQHKEQ